MLLFGLLLLGGLQRYAAASGHSDETIKVFVSILPQAYFVERVGGDRVDVSVMVGPGQSPATYEPRPRQMAGLPQAKLYFRIGVPFEDVWMDRISKANPEMSVCDTRQGIELLRMKAQHEDAREAGHDHVAGMKDPHIWLSLRLVKIQAKNICDGLVAADPLHRGLYQENLNIFQGDLDTLDAKITNRLKDLKARKFMVFHPAWGYFAQDYGLEQVPIEIEGKQPSARALNRLVEQAKEEGIKVIFVQKQFGKQSAESVARAIGGKVVEMDPLALDYLDNMRRIAETFVQVLQ